MTSSAHLRAKHLYDIERYDDALREYVQIVQQDPDDAGAVSMVALCEASLGHSRRASENAKRAVAMAPDDPNLHFNMALVYSELGKVRPAHRAIDEAIRIDPDDAGSLTLKAALCTQSGDWRAAKDWARHALDKDPDSESAQNIYAQALALTGSVEEAASVGAKALYDSPDSADAHCTNGYIYLRQGKHRKAAEHFREALRIEPNNESAVDGMAQALRSIFPLYRWYLQGQLWIAGQRKWMQYAIIIAVLVIPRVLRAFAREAGAFAPYLYALAVPFTLFIWFSWFGESLLNVMLRFHPFGKYLIKRHESVEAYFFLAFVVFVVAGLGFLLVGNSVASGVLGTSLIGALAVGLSTYVKSNLTLRAILVWTLGLAFLGLALLFTFVGLVMPLPVKD